MGRLADAANTYQRYLTDPATGAERVAEVKELLIKLETELTILTVHVTPHGSEVSIDGGPFVPVGSSLQLRVRPGTHTIRLKKGAAASTTDLNTFEGEARDVVLALEEVPNAPAPPPQKAARSRTGLARRSHATARPTATAASVASRRSPAPRSSRMSRAARSTTKRRRPRSPRST